MESIRFEVNPNDVGPIEIVVNGTHYLNEIKDGVLEVLVPAPSTLSYTVSLKGYQSQSGLKQIQAVRRAELPPIQINLQQLPNWCVLGGKVSHPNGSVPYAMVLASGEYRFSSDPDGKFKFAAPFNEKNEIEIFCFCEGFSPKKKTLPKAPQHVSNFDLVQTPGDQIQLTYSFVQTDPIHYSIEGIAYYKTKAQNAMVLASEKFVFTSEHDGIYKLEDVPVKPNGKIELYGFCEGLQPFKAVLP
jgi:hypothetical protein